MPAAVDPAPAPVPRGDFLLATCHGGAEGILRQRLLGLLPGARPGAWRRGIVTIRLPPPLAAADDPLAGPLAGAVFARTLCHCFGQVAGADDAARAEALRALLPPAGYGRLHVWRRDPRPAPGAADDGIAGATAALVARLPRLLPGVADPGDLVLDVVLDGADRWWVGWHRAESPSSRHPGGAHALPLPPDKVSRAWLKLDEALESFGVRLVAGQRAVELGAAPGGASQRLLEAGLEVVGIDPAVIDPRVAGHPRFTHWRKRARDVRLREFRSFDWVVTDMNIDPVSTLEALGRILTAPGVRPRGVIATLKLPDWGRATALDEWLAMVRSWGLVPRARQLAGGGREVCVVALRGAGAVRPPRRRATPPRGR